MGCCGSGEAVSEDEKKKKEQQQKGKDKSGGGDDGDKSRGVDDPFAVDGENKNEDGDGEDKKKQDGDDDDDASKQQQQQQQQRLGADGNPLPVEDEDLSAENLAKQERYKDLSVAEIQAKETELLEKKRKLESARDALRNGLKAMQLLSDKDGGVGDIETALMPTIMESEELATLLDQLSRSVEGIEDSAKASTLVYKAATLMEALGSVDVDDFREMKPVEKSRKIGAISRLVEESRNCLELAEKERLDQKTKNVAGDAAAKHIKDTRGFPDAPTHSGVNSAANSRNNTPTRGGSPKGLGGGGGSSTRGGRRGASSSSPGGKSTRSGASSSPGGKSSRAGSPTFSNANNSRSGSNNSKGGGSNRRQNRVGHEQYRDSGSNRTLRNRLRGPEVDVGDLFGDDSPSNSRGRRRSSNMMAGRRPSPKAPSMMSRSNGSKSGSPPRAPPRPLNSKMLSSLNRSGSRGGAGAAPSRPRSYGGAARSTGGSPRSVVFPGGCDTTSRQEAARQRRLLSEQNTSKKKKKRAVSLGGGGADDYEFRASTRKPISVTGKNCRERAVNYDNVNREGSKRRRDAVAAASQRSGSPNASRRRGGGAGRSRASTSSQHIGPLLDGKALSFAAPIEEIIVQLLHASKLVRSKGFADMPLDARSHVLRMVRDMLCQCRAKAVSDPNVAAATLETEQLLRTHRAEDGGDAESEAPLSPLNASGILSPAGSTIHVPSRGGIRQATSVMAFIRSVERLLSKAEADLVKLFSKSGADLFVLPGSSPPNRAASSNNRLGGGSTSPLRRASAVAASDLASADGLDDFERGSPVGDADTSSSAAATDASTRRDAPIRVLLGAFKLLASADFASMLPYERDQLVRLMRNQLIAARRSASTLPEEKRLQLDQLFVKVTQSLDAQSAPKPRRGASAAFNGREPNYASSHQSKFSSARGSDLGSSTFSSPSPSVSMAGSASPYNLNTNTNTNISTPSLLRPITSITNDPVRVAVTAAKNAQNVQQSKRAQQQRLTAFDQIADSVTHSRKMLCAPGFAIMTADSQTQIFDLIDEQIKRAKEDVDLLSTVSTPHQHQQLASSFVADRRQATVTEKIQQLEIVVTATRDRVTKRHSNVNDPNKKSLRAEAAERFSKSSQNQDADDYDWDMDDYLRRNKTLGTWSRDGKSLIGVFNPTHWMFSPPPPSATSTTKTQQKSQRPPQQPIMLSVITSNNTFDESAEPILVSQIPANDDDDVQENTQPQVEDEAPAADLHVPQNDVAVVDEL